MPLIETIPLLTAVKTALQALCAPAATGEKPTLLFDLVDFYSERDFQGGLDQLLKSTAKRVCLIVPGGDNHSTQGTNANAVFLKRTTDFALLIADKSYKPGAVEAAFGGPETLGAIKAKDIVVRELTGKNLGFTGAALVPGTGSLLTAGNQDKARPFWIQQFSTFAGEDVVPVE